MSAAVQNHPQPSREDLYFGALDDFLRISATHLDADAGTPVQEVAAAVSARVARVETPD
ncbi:MAG TPA: hypothetical protein VET88_03720 [Gammaproteobacteria bacterium]|nr:hypothetical protein [Gammaproteobacteria bacterium]